MTAIAIAKECKILDSDKDIVINFNLLLVYNGFWTRKCNSIFFGII